MNSNLGPGFVQTLNTVFQDFPGLAKTKFQGFPGLKQESPADARVTRDSSACIPPSWIFEI